MKKVRAELREEMEMEADMPRLNQVVLVPGPNAGIQGSPTDTQSVTSSVSSMSRREKRQLVMRRSKSMAEGLIQSLMQCNKTWDAFEEAGVRSIEAAEAAERLELNEAALECALTPDEVSRLEVKVSEAMRDVADQATYRTAEEKGCDQGAFLKALDLRMRLGQT